MLTTVLVLSLLAAVSPVMLVNSALLLTTSGRRATGAYALGGILVLAVLVAAGAGLIGAGLSAWLSEELSSRLADGVLALVLFVYAFVLAKRVSHQGQPDLHRPDTAHPPLLFGILGMVTNYTSLPLVLAASQDLGAAGLPMWETLPMLAVIVVVSALPAWAPLPLSWIRPAWTSRLGGRGERPRDRHRWMTWVPAVTCLLGGIALAMRAAGWWG